MSNIAKISLKTFDNDLGQENKFLKKDTDRKYATNWATSLWFTISLERYIESF